LDHSNAYTAAVALAIAEHLFLSRFIFKWKLISSLGLMIAILGQCLRSKAMHDAGKNFTHQVASECLPSHTLVTHGVYSWMRHPSYTGFLLLALGMQLLLSNVLCFCGYSFVLCKFFRERIVEEEESLSQFFGKDYETYRKATWSGFPRIIVR